MIRRRGRGNSRRIVISSSTTDLLSVDGNAADGDGQPDGHCAAAIGSGSGHDSRNRRGTMTTSSSSASLLHRQRIEVKVVRRHGVRGLLDVHRLRLRLAHARVVEVQRRQVPADVLHAQPVHHPGGKVVAGREVVLAALQRPRVVAVVGLEGVAGEEEGALLAQRHAVVEDIFSHLVVVQQLGDLVAIMRCGGGGLGAKYKHELEREFSMGN